LEIKTLKARGTLSEGYSLENGDLLEGYSFEKGKQTIFPL